MTSCSREREAGFTLLELLVSLALAALLMAAVPATVRFAKRGLTVAAELDTRARADAALAFLEQRLSQSTAIYDRGDDGRLRIIFEGSPQSIVFVAPVTFKTEDSGLARFKVSIGSDGDGRGGLILTWQPWRPTLAGGQSAETVEPRSRLLVSPAQDFALRYFGAPSASEDPEWSDTWQRGDSLPDLVEFRVTVSGGATVRVAVLHLKGG